MLVFGNCVDSGNAICKKIIIIIILVCVFLTIHFYTDHYVDAMLAYICVSCCVVFIPK